MYKKETKYRKPYLYQKELRRWAKKRYPTRNSRVVADLIDFRMKQSGVPTKQTAHDTTNKKNQRHLRAAG